MDFYFILKEGGFERERGFEERAERAQAPERENSCFPAEEGREQSERWKTVGFQKVRFRPPELIEKCTPCGCVF